MSLLSTRLYRSFIGSAHRRAAGQQINTTDPAVAVRIRPRLKICRRHLLQQQNILAGSRSGAVVGYVRQCWASLWTARAVSTGKARFDHLEVALSVVVKDDKQRQVGGDVHNQSGNQRSEQMINTSWVR